MDKNAGSGDWRHGGHDPTTVVHVDYDGFTPVPHGHPRSQFSRLHSLSEVRHDLLHLL